MSFNAVRFLTHSSAKATDPFLDATPDEDYLSRICERLDEDGDGPAIVMRLLSHKMLSPNHDEAYKALEVIL